LDGAKPQPVDQQSRGFPDNFILENKILWMHGMVGKVRFQLEEWMQPFAITCEYGRAFMQYGEGWYLLYRFRHGFEFPVQFTSDIIVLLQETATRAMPE
jgi:hypothetical protein